jgi:hypothetical protein
MLLLSCLLGCAGSPQTRSSAPSKPAWIDNAASLYPEGQIVSAVGYGGDRGTAEKNALGSLVSVFGQTVQGETRINYRYAEAMAGGLITPNESSEFQDAVMTSYAQDTLIGAEIKDTWVDGQETHYAIAVMDKAKCGLLYRNLIESNERTIQKLTNLEGIPRDSIEACARYELAISIAGANASFVNILSVLSPAPAALLRNEIQREADLRLELRKITGNIPIAIRVVQDRSGRIGAAFAQVLSGAGFSTGGNGDRYQLEASVSMEEVSLPQNQNKFIRYVIDAKLRDTANNQILFPYSINGRAGHLNLSEAENRAIRDMENGIQDSFAGAFAAYLNQLTPKMEK